MATLKWPRYSRAFQAAQSSDNIFTVNCKEIMKRFNLVHIYNTEKAQPKMLFNCKPKL